MDVINFFMFLNETDKLLTRVITKFSIFGSVFVLLLAISSKAQKPDEVMNPIRPNLKVLEHLIKIKVDSVRKVNGLPALLNDTILYLSSRNHARFLTKEVKLSHYQPGSKARRTYQERAAKFGAEDYYVSENLAQGSVYLNGNRENGILTYRQLAGLMFEQWNASIGCMVNIIAPSHVITGIAAWYEPESGEVRVAASFAAVTRSYKPRHYQDMFPFADPKEASNYKSVIPSEKPPRTYQWGIGSKPDQKVLDRYRKYSKLINTISLIHDNDTVFVVFNSPKSIDKLFEESNDGIAIELITKDLYRCERKVSELIRSENEFTLKGELLQPVYRNELLKGIADVKRKPKISVKFVAAIPQKYKSEECILNLVIIKGNKIADIVTLNKAPSKVFDLALSLPPARDSLPNPDYYIPHLRRDTLKLRVYFEQNKANLPQKISDSISNWVEDKRIQRAAVYAYASIEGTDEINKGLTEQRAKETMSYFDTRDGQKVHTVKVTQENWHRFFQDIKDSKYQFLYNIDSVKIRAYVNQKLNSREMEPILARHRYVDLKILAYKIVNDVSIDGLAFNEYNNIYTGIKSDCYHQVEPCVVSENLITRMEQVQLFLFDRNRKGRVSWKDIDKLPIGLYSGNFDVYSEPLAKLHYNKLRFRLAQFGSSFSRIDSLQTLKELNRFPNPDPVIAYNYFILMLNERNTDDPELFYRQNKLNEMQSLISTIEGSDFDQATINRLKLYYHFKNAEQEFFMNRLGEYPADVKASLNYILDFFRYIPPDKQTSLNLAMFFSAFRYFDAALDILEPYAFAEKPVKDAFMLYLKVFYANPRVKQSTDFYQFLKDAGDILSPNEWCGLFGGEYPVNLQVLDHEPLRMMYCKICRN